MAGQVVKRLHRQLLIMPKLHNVVPDLKINRIKFVYMSTKVGSPETLHKQLTNNLPAKSFSFASSRLQMDGSDDVKDIETRSASKTSESHRLASSNVLFLPIDDTNVQQLHEINKKLFPIKYNNAFYEYVVDAPEGYCTLACTATGAAIGAICCGLEDVKISGKRRVRLCILTLGVSEEHRRSKLGTGLLESVISQARKDQLAYVYLHVQSCNTAALHFYFARGFQFVKFVHNYYPEINPPHCFVLRLQLDATTRVHAT